MAVPYFPALDGLRLMSCLLVLVGHALNDAAVKAALPSPVVTWLHGSARLGVEMFFALSGFLITGILLRDHDLRRFYIRRTLRIWPVYYVAVAIGLAVMVAIRTRPSLGGAVLYSPTPAALTTGAIGSLLFVRNWMNIAQPSTTGVLWSLCVEEQFYLIFPLLIVACRSAARPAVIGLAVAAGARWWAVRHGVGAGMIYGNTITHCDCLLWGALAAELRARGPRVRLPAVALAFACVALPMVYVDVPSTVWQWEWTYAISGPLAAALVYELSFLDSCPRWMQAGGRLTYAAYVFHVYAIVVAWHLPPALRVGAVIALTFSIAWLSRRYLELPFLRIKNRH